MNSIHYKYRRYCIIIKIQYYIVRKIPGYKEEEKEEVFPFPLRFEFSLYMYCRQMPSGL